MLHRRRSARAGVAATNASAARPRAAGMRDLRSEEHTSELQSRQYLVCRLLLEKKRKNPYFTTSTRPCAAEKTSSVATASVYSPTTTSAGQVGRLAESHIGATFSLRSRSRVQYQ